MTTSMPIARPTGLTPDGSGLIVRTESGEELIIAVDDGLRETLRGAQASSGDRAGQAQREMQMENELRPREIQERIRAGASAEQVAEDAGVPVERIQAFAAPVLAERAHVTSLALASTVRRRGEALGRSLRDVVGEQLTRQQMRHDDLQWDAWRGEDRQWRLTAVSPAAGERPAREATFRFDLKARFSAAENDDARWLLTETSTPVGRRGGADPDSEPTEDLDDELALVRAVAHSRPLEDSDMFTEPDREDSGPVWRPGAPRHDSGRLPRYQPRPTPTPAVPERPAAVSPPSTPAEAPPTEPVAESDPYDIIPSDQSDLDVLYEMLGGLQEDSVNIYAGLSDPVADDPVRRGDGEDEESTRARRTPRKQRRQRRRAAAAAEPAGPETAEGPPGSAADESAASGAPTSSTVVTGGRTATSESPAAPNPTHEVEAPADSDSGESGDRESGAGESGARESGAGASVAGKSGTGESGARESGARASGAVVSGAGVSGAGASGADESGAGASPILDPGAAVPGESGDGPTDPVPVEPAPTGTAATKPAPSESARAEDPPADESPVEPTGSGGPSTQRSAGADTAPADPDRGAADRADAEGPEPEQPSLLEDEAPPAEEPVKPRGGKRKRASVPSWDEIMFGSPRR